MRYIERLPCASAARTCSSYPEGTPAILAGWHPCGLIYGRALTSLHRTRRGGAGRCNSSRSSRADRSLNFKPSSIDRNKDDRILFRVHEKQTQRPNEPRTTSSLPNPRVYPPKVNVPALKHIPVHKQLFEFDLY